MLDCLASFPAAVRALLAFLTFAGFAHAQFPWSAVHTVTGTTSTAVTIMGKSGSGYTTRFASPVVCSSQAATFTLELGGTAPTSTLSAEYPWYTKDSLAPLFPLATSWPLSFYTASNASGGKVIGKLVFTGANCSGFNGISVDKRYWTLEIQRSSTQFYTVRAALGASGDVTFALNGDVIK